MVAARWYPRYGLSYRDVVAGESGPGSVDLV